MPSDSQLFESELLSPFHRHHPKTGLTISCMYHCFIYMYIYIYNLLFIYFWLCWVIVVAWISSLVAATEGYSSLPHAGFLMQKLVAEHIF